MELADQVLSILPETEQILKDMGQGDVLQTSSWKRYVKRHFLNLEKDFNMPTV